MLYLSRMNVFATLGTAAKVGLMACVIAGAAACRSGSGNMQRHEATSGVFAIELPAQLDARNDMHDYASLQYGDDRSGWYVMALEDPKKKIASAINGGVALNTYYNFVETAAFNGADTTILLSPAQEFERNNYHARYADYEVTTTRNGNTHTLFYRIAVYESSGYFFQVVIWMPRKLFEANKEQVDAIVKSFEVIEKA